MKVLLTFLIVVVSVDLWATVTYDDVSCVIADHHWLALIGASMLSSVITGTVVRYRLKEG